MADKDEFLEENVEEKVEEKEEGEAEEEKAEERIKVGEEEYTQEELDRLVKLGKIGVEAEEKFDTKIDRIWPEFTTKSQKLKELEGQINKREEEATQAKVAEGKELSPDEQRTIYRDEARKLGLVLDDDFDKMYAQRRAAERLTEDTEDTVLEANEKYGFKTNVKELLEHMAETGIRSPEKALKDKFEPQIDKWKEEELAKKKGTGLVTEESSTAGGKEPKPVKITRDNLGEQLKEALGQ